MFTARRLVQYLHRRPGLVDAVLAAALVVLMLLSIEVDWGLGARISKPVAYGLALVLVVPLAWRRRYPLAVLAVATAALAAFTELEVPEGLWSLNVWWLALYSAGAYGQGRRRDLARAAAAAVFIGFVVRALLFTDMSGFDGSRALLRLVTLLSNALFLGAVWWFGDAVRVRREREAELAERTAQLEQEREENARRAVLDERVRIARELHDVVAHHVSVMGVQAGAARRVLDRQPDKATETLTAIEATSRQAVAELHRLLGFLRQEEDDAGLAPQPGLRQLDGLIAQMREAGLPVELQVHGQPRPLPPGVDLSAYRIVQEALTNALKHAGRAQTTVVVRYGEGAVDLEVIDDGRGAKTPPPAQGGNGLIGMRERVGLLGGQLQVGREPGAGFAVRAHLPLRGQPS